MEITDIRIRKVDTEGKLKAYVTLTFDNCFVVHNLKIISGQAGTFVAMPSRKTNKGEYKDIAHPINSEFRGTLQTKILDEYSKLESQDEENEVIEAEPKEVETKEEEVVVEEEEKEEEKEEEIKEDEA